MKIRNHRKREYWFYPTEDSKLNKDRCYMFNYKSDLISFLNKNIDESVNGTVRLEESGFGYSGAVRQWFVWYNDYSPRNSKLRIDLRQLNFRGKKFIQKRFTVGNERKKYFAFSKKVIHLMCNIKQEDGTILSKDVKKLVELFNKRGFKDFEPSEEDWLYINGHIGDGISFYHWSDRLDDLRTKTVIEYFKREGLI